MYGRDKTVTLSPAEYDRLCYEACADFVPTGSKEKDEETLFLAICREVYGYLDLHFMFMPIQGVSPLNKYKQNLLMVISGRQSELFDPLQIAGRHIHEALGKAYN